MQFHPELNLYGFNKLSIPHNTAALEVTSLMAERFVNDAKLNAHKFSGFAEETQSLVQTQAQPITFLDALEDYYIFGNVSM